MRRRNLLLLAAVCLAVLAAAAGCGSQARQYAQEARSSYITARAVLVGVAEFPAQMETILRSGSIESETENAEGLIEDARELLPTASSAFRTVSENAESLKEEGGEKFTPYADKLLELVSLNEEIINAYSEFIGLSNAVLQGLFYGDNPQELMPTLNYMDAVIVRIEELTAQLQQLEAEAESLYLALME